MNTHPRNRAFLDLLEPIKESLERYAVRSSWNRQQAQDIVQEAVMTAWREFDRFQRGTDFRAWMFRVLVNTVYSQNKRVNRERQNRAAFANEDFQHVMQKESAWTSVLEDPEDVVQQLDDRLVQALTLLGGDERQCFLLRALEGFSYKEISAMLDIPMGTVMSHVHRSRMKLRERLAELAVENGFSPGVSYEV